MSRLPTATGVYEFFTSDRVLAVFLAGLLVFGAGCSGLLGDDGGGDSAAVDSVPENVDGVIHFDSGIIQDDATVTFMNGLLEMSGENQTYQEILDEIESESDLSMEDFNSATTFMRLEDYEQEEYAGTIVDTEWTWEQLQEAGDEEVEDPEEDEYNGVTVYKSTDEMGQETWAADFGDGVFAFGTPDAVRDTIDTREGDANSFGGELRTAYDNVEDGYMKAAFIVPEEEVNQASEEAGVDANYVPTPQIMTMTYYTNGETMNLDTQMTLASEEEAEQFSQVVGATLDPPSNDGGNQADPFTRLVDAISVEQDGENVTIDFSMAASDLVDLIEQLAQSFGGGMGPGMDDSGFSSVSTSAPSLAG
jgi:hypothetical protein